MNSLQHTPQSAVVCPLIFVVEDEAEIAGLISFTLRQAGFEVQSFANGASVIAEGMRLRPSLFILDIVLPGVDGFELCRRIRKTAVLSSSPIIFVSAKCSEGDRVKGLELGGDDYVTKPFSPRELLARVRGLLRASYKSPASQETLRVGDLEVDLASMTVKIRGCPVEITVREFRLLEYLVMCRGHVLSRDQILATVWKETPFVTPRSVDVYIRRLREKIEVDSEKPRYLKTLRGVGYRLEGPD